jgi:hypothetical protein
MCTVQMGSAHCASQAGPARGSRLACPFGPRLKSRGARLAMARGHGRLAAVRPSRRCWRRGPARRGLGGPGQHDKLIWGVGKEGGSPGLVVHDDGFWLVGNEDGGSVWWSGWLASGLRSNRRMTRSSRRWRPIGEGPEAAIHGEVLTEADGDGIGSLQGIAWWPAARRRGTAWGVEVGDDGVAPVTLVEVVHRQRQQQAEQRSG